MKNAYLPAMPIFSSEAKPCQIRDVTTQSTVPASGLSKREYFAGLAMQGLLSKHGDDDYATDSIAKYAISHADALLAELERTK